VTNVEPAELSIGRALKVSLWTSDWIAGTSLWLKPSRAAYKGWTGSKKQDCIPLPKYIYVRGRSLNFMAELYQNLSAQITKFIVNAGLLLILLPKN
jgi:hypothetical protein